MKFVSILKKDLLLLLRDRAEMAVLFLMPLAFILPISFALGGGDGYAIQQQNQMIVIPVVNYDQGPRAQELLTIIGESLRLEPGQEPETLAALGLLEAPECAPIGTASEFSQSPAAGEAPAAGETQPGGTAASQAQTTEDAADAGPTAAAETSTPAPTALPTEPANTAEAGSGAIFSPACDEKAALVMLQRSWRTAALIIPPGFSDSLNTGRRTWVTLLYDPTGDPTRAQQVEGVVKGATIRVSVENQVERGMDFMAELAAYAPDDLRAEVEKQAAQPAAENQQPAINLVKVSPTSEITASTPDTYQQTVPGYTVMFAFFIITSLAGSIRQERLNGTFRRLLNMPVTRFDLLLGKFAASLIIVLAQVIILFGVGALLFDLWLGSDLLALLLLTTALAAAAASLGLAAAATGLRGAALAGPLVIAALLGGCMFPLDLMPPAMRTLSYFVPHSWALSGYQDLIVRGHGLGSILPNIGVLLAFAAVCFLFAVQRLAQEE